MLNLPKVTLIAVDGTGNDTDKLSEVLGICTRKINFGDVVLITADKSLNQINDFTLHHIDKMNYKDYNLFCISDMNKYINTEFCLIIQTDGFICKPTNWTDEFLNYDYLGCP